MRTLPDTAEGQRPEPVGELAAQPLPLPLRLAVQVRDCGLQPRPPLLEAEGISGRWVR